MFENIRADYQASLRASFALLPGGRRYRGLMGKLQRFNIVAIEGPWLPVVLYRAKTWARERKIPVLPFVCDALNRLGWGVFIGHYVEIGPGVLIPHGNVVIDGAVKIGKNCVINPFVTIGLRVGSELAFSLRGPIIGDNVYIGTGAKVLGTITVGDNARVGANAVVLSDVPDNFTAVGVPARMIPEAPLWKLVNESREEQASGGHKEV